MFDQLLTSFADAVASTVGTVEAGAVTVRQALPTGGIVRLVVAAPVDRTHRRHALRLNAGRAAGDGPPAPLRSAARVPHFGSPPVLLDATIMSTIARILHPPLRRHTGHSRADCKSRASRLLKSSLASTYDSGEMRVQIERSIRKLTLAALAADRAARSGSAVPGAKATGTARAAWRDRRDCDSRLRPV